MKKLFLLFACGFTFASAIAQENASVIFNPSVTPEIAKWGAHPVTDYSAIQHKLNNSGARTTSTYISTSYSNWFDYVGQNTSSSHTGNLFYFEIYPDSTLVDNSSGTAYNTGVHGLGMSFDPTDAGYYGVYSGAGTINPITDPPMPDTVGFTVDSFAVPFQYMYNHASATPDSMIVELFAVSYLTGSGSSASYDSGTYALRYPSAASWLDISADSQARFSTVLYTPTASGLGPNETWDSITSTKQRYAFALTAADTAAGSVMQFGLTTPLVVEPGRKVVSFVHMKSMSTYTLGTNINSANWMKLFGGTTGSTTNTWPAQTAHNVYYPGYAGSYQTGLVANNQLRYVYAGDTSGFTYQSSSVLIPGVAFNNPGATDNGASFVSVTDQAFHVNWSTNVVNGVANVTNTINGASAFPNPANNTVNVTFNLSSSANATVTLTNAVGQVVATQELKNVTNGTATFNTNTLAPGLYIYSVNANGARTTGSITVAH